MAENTGVCALEKLLSKASFKR